MARAAKGVKKPARKAAKTVRKSAALKTKKTVSKRAAPKPPPEKRAAAKDLQIATLKADLQERNRQVKESMKVLKEAMAKAGKEVAESKKKAGEELRDLQRKADAEMKKMEKELLLKGRILQEKEKELENCKKEAQAKIAAPSVPEKERTGLTTFKGSPMTLVGEEIRVGDKAPDFRVMDNGMQPVGLSAYQGKIKIITSVPSLDTPVCSMETRRFNEEAEKLPEKAAVLTISMDLPFAQARWCAAAGVEKVKTFSDYQERSFGLRYGVLLKELKLLARAVFVVDDQDIVRYIELVPEIGREPDYNQALNAARTLL